MVVSTRLSQHDHSATKFTSVSLAPLGPTPWEGKNQRLLSKLNKSSALLSIIGGLLSFLFFFALFAQASACKVLKPLTPSSLSPADTQRKQVNF